MKKKASLRRNVNKTTSTGSSLSTTAIPYIIQSSIPTVNSLCMRRSICSRKPAQGAWKQHLQKEPKCSGERRALRSGSQIPPNISRRFWRGPIRDAFSRLWSGAKKCASLSEKPCANTFPTKRSPRSLRSGIKRSPSMSPL
ncbi:hypothetical protein SDC9_59308 [bioreactor metagenome]|uniref:Uncharacterized protein n=1 Tax=bioreactor metagenome TaxID=1076179 RepID=A0A644XFL1_9ZZZZ